MHTEKSLGKRLQQVRKALGYTQSGISDVVGSKMRSWQEYEKGSRTPGGQVFAGLVNIGVNANWVLTGEGPMLIKDLATSEGREKNDQIIAEVVSKAVQIALNQLDTADQGNQLGVAERKGRYEFQPLPPRENSEKNETLDDTYITELRKSGRDFFSEWYALKDTDLQSAIMKELVGKTIAHDLVSSQFKKPMRKAKPPKQEKKRYGGTNVALRRTGSKNEK